MNILIKLMSIVSLVIAPTLATISGAGHGTHANASQQLEINEKVVIEGQNQKFNNEIGEAVNAIKAAGLVNENESYSIAFMDGMLTINEEVVPQNKVDEIAFNKDIQFKVETEINKITN